MVGSKHAGVFLVMSLGISSRDIPTARRAAIFAIGNPVALLASAELRETRGFISITTMRPFSGFTANCTLDPPVSTPTSRIIAAAASRMRWYSLSVRVCAGATVIESPVCTPMGSKFSIEQITTKLSEVAHHLQFVLFPAQHGFFHQGFVYRAHVQRMRDGFGKLFLVVGDRAAGAAQRERRPYHQRKSQLIAQPQRILRVVHKRRSRHLQPDLPARILEPQAVLG